MGEASIDHEPVSADGQRPGQPDLKVYHPEKADSGPVIVEDELTKRRRGVNKYSDAMVEAMAERGVAERGDSVLDAARVWEEKHAQEITPGEIHGPLKTASEWLFMHEKYFRLGSDVPKPNEFGLGILQCKRLREASDNLRQQMKEVVRSFRSPSGLKVVRESLSQVNNALAKANKTFDEIQKEVEQGK